MKTLCIYGLIVGFLFASGVEAQKKVYRWVDEQGEIHYTESLPPDMDEKKHDVLDGRGLIREENLSLAPPPPPPKNETKKGELPRDASGMKRPKPLYTPEQMKVQQDALLLLRYHSDEEIAEAMKNEISNLAYDERLLTTSRDSLMDAYLGNIREAAERQRAGIELQPKLVGDINNLKLRLTDNASSIAALKEREKSIRASFESQLERYRTLSAEIEANDT
jgi:hypothetical protein